MGADGIPAPGMNIETSFLKKKTKYKSTKIKGGLK